ncbi:MAG: type III secretion system cytoplasmic ring protein SctQ [Myxococcota bacterium]
MTTRGGASSPEHTMLIKAPTRPPTKGGGSAGGTGSGGTPTRSWRPFRFSNLEKVSKRHAQLIRNLEWMLPSVRATGEVSSSVRKRLQEMLEEQVSLQTEYVHVVPLAKLRRYIGEPTFLAVLTPQPNKTRGLLEIELGLAHQAIDMLLGGAGEAVALRPLTDIEEGVMTYVIIETLKALAPSLDPSLPKLRIEGVVRGFEDAASLIGEDESLAVVQLKAVFGQHSGYVRLFIPETVLATANPPPDSEVRKARRAADAVTHRAWLKSVRAALRAEIGQVEISAGDLAQLRERDVVLVEALSCRPDQGAGGTAKLRLGRGQSGHIDAEVTVEDGRFMAKVTGFNLGTPPPPGGPAEEPAAEAEGGAAEENEPAALGDGPEESTSPGQLKGRDDVDEGQGGEGAEMLNDIPLQIAVEIGRVPVTADEVVSLKVGHVFDLNRVAGEPLDLSVNGRIVARGELVEVDGNLGVRILTLAG